MSHPQRKHRKIVLMSLVDTRFRLPPLCSIFPLLGSSSTFLFFYDNFRIFDTYFSAPFQSIYSNMAAKEKGLKFYRPHSQLTKTTATKHNASELLFIGSNRWRKASSSSNSSTSPPQNNVSWQNWWALNPLKEVCVDVTIALVRMNFWTSDQRFDPSNELKKEMLDWKLDCLKEKSKK